uniref:Uncharacterized protein n=1 Tax=Anguilla anguilla TaxID=7936 RepID=A0A0E9V9Q5_ANGAN
MPHCRLQSSSQSGGRGRPFVCSFDIR